MTSLCVKCGGEMQRGFTTSQGLVQSKGVEDEKRRLMFVVLHSPTSSNPLKAFAQGLAGEPQNEPLPIDGLRCSLCGYLELYAKHCS